MWEDKPRGVEGGSGCEKCGSQKRGVSHYLWECRRVREDSEILGRLIREDWGEERWNVWQRGNEGEKTAEILGLKGTCSKKQKLVVSAFFEYVSKAQGDIDSGARVLGLR